MALLAMDEIGKLKRVADEEHGRVVADHVPISVLGVELKRKAPDVALGIRGASLACDCGETDQQVRLLSDAVEQAGFAISRNVVRHGKYAVRAGSLSVHHPFRHTLSVLMRQLLEQVIVLQENRAMRSSRFGILVVRDSRTSRSCQHGTFRSAHLRTALPRRE